MPVVCYNGYVSLIGNWRINESGRLHSSRHVHIGLHNDSCIYYLCICIVVYACHSLIHLSLIRLAIPLCEIVSSWKLSYVPISIVIIAIDHHCSCYIYIEFPCKISICHTCHVYTNTLSQVFYYIRSSTSLNHFRVFRRKIRAIARLGVDSQLIYRVAMVHDKVLVISIIISKAHCWCPMHG